jgi:transcriptional regulator with XRE-family HTH domain
MAHFRILEICKERGITQKELAEIIGISRVGLSKALNGNTTIGTLEKVATALNVPIVSLFEAENDFIAFVRRNGETFTFESEKALKEYADTLPTETDQPV